MRYWIFQGNPDRFDINGYLRLTSDIYWSVTKKRDQREVSVGDGVFIWRARGKTDLEPGVVAYGNISQRCLSTSEISEDIRLGENLWGSPDGDPTDIKAGIAISGVRLTPDDGMISLSDVRIDPVLSKMKIVTVRTGTNFEITSEEFAVIARLWATHSEESAEEAFGEYQASEGRIRLNIHKRRERSKKLVQEAKQAFKKQHGSLYCEICRFSFEDVYGDIGAGFIEAHHSMPLSKLDENSTTLVSDLMMVCSNCHRMLHQGDPNGIVTRLKAIFA